MSKDKNTNLPSPKIITIIETFMEQFKDGDGYYFDQKKIHEFLSSHTASSSSSSPSAEHKINDTV